MEFSFAERVCGMKPSAIREIFKSLTDPTVISFAAGNPSPLSFPADEIRAIADDILTQKPALALQYGITEGYAPLREQLRARAAKRFSVGGEGDDIIVTSGGQQGIDLCARVLLNEGDSVICENPSFIGALNAFRSYGANLCGVECDSEGMDIDKLENAGFDGFYILGQSEEIKMFE